MSTLRRATLLLPLLLAASGLACGESASDAPASPSSSGDGDDQDPAATGKDASPGGDRDAAPDATTCAPPLVVCGNTCCPSSGPLPIVRRTLSAGAQATCALTAAGGVKCWGHNAFGSLGTGVPTPAEVPTDVIGLSSGIVSVSRGGTVGCAITSSGGLKCWGYNQWGAVGDGSTTATTTAVDVVGLGSGVVDVVTGFSHTCALTSAGKVKCWGNNSLGQLGSGTPSLDDVGSATPVDVVGLGANVVALARVSAEASHTCALTSAGEVKCWGANGSGQLGAPKSSHSVTPVTALTSVPTSGPSLAVGDNFSCARVASGGVSCWGGNQLRQLGRGQASTQDSHTPGPVVDATGVIQISAGGEHACASTASAVLCWGSNADARLGDGKRGTVPLGPQMVVGIGATKDLSMGDSHSCARLADDSVRCWGNNSTRALGDGTNFETDVPVTVVGL